MTRAIIPTTTADYLRIVLQVSGRLSWPGSPFLSRHPHWQVAVSCYQPNNTRHPIFNRSYFLVFIRKLKKRHVGTIKNIIINIYPLKGQSHKKVGEMRVEGDSLGPN
jgi:hypothetical protein